MKTSHKVLIVAAFLVHFCISLHVLSRGHVIEDAYILYIYSESLSNGNGIAYFRGGEHAEGATDFLWLILLSAANFVGIDVAVAAAALNSLGLAVVSYLAISLLRERCQGRQLTIYSICTILILGSSQIAAASMGGFSAGMYCSIAAVLFYILYTRKSFGLLVLPYVGILNGLVRPDGVIVGMTASVIGFVLTLRTDLRKKYWANLALSLVLGLLYFVWRYRYFGNLLPLPLYVKGASPSSLPGLIQNLEWIVTNGFLFIAFVCALIFAKDRVKILIASLPVLVLFSVSVFAIQSQNIIFRFQAPITAVSILVFALFFSGSWEGYRETFSRAKRYIFAVFVVGTCVVNVILFRLVYIAQRQADYINYFPYYLNRHIDDDAKIALTEAGRMGYWMKGKKYDLVGLNTPYTAKNKVSPSYISTIDPDLIFIHTDATAEFTALCAPKNFCKLTKAELKNAITSTQKWENVSYGVRRAPLAVYDYLNSTSTEYELYVVRYYELYEHLYAVKLGGKIAIGDFESSLEKSFDSNAVMSYLEMKKKSANVFSGLTQMTPR